LEEQFDKMERRLSVAFVANVGLQILSRLEKMHSVGILHRDVKPENFLFGDSQKRYILYVLDFGLSKRYIDLKTKEHIPFRTDKRLTGTPRYAAVGMLKK
jgi:serine/threonine protein kinase